MNLYELTDDELRAEVRRRGYEMHSTHFSAAAQVAIRELGQLRNRVDQVITEYQRTK